MESDIQWFIARDGKQHGPISDPEMKKLVEMGHLRPNDLLWRLGFADWRPAPSVFPPPAAAAPPVAAAPPMAAPAPQPVAEPQPQPQSQPYVPSMTSAADQAPAPSFQGGSEPQFQPAAQSQPAMAASQPGPSQPFQMSPSFEPQPRTQPTSPFGFGAPQGAPQPSWQQPQPANVTPAGTASPSFGAPSFQAPSFGSSPFGSQPAPQPSFGAPTANPAPAQDWRADPRPVAASDYSVDYDDEKPKGGLKKVVLGTTLLALFGASGFYGYTHFDSLKTTAQQSLTATSKAVKETATNSKPAEGETPAAGAKPAAPSANAESAAAIDARLQKLQHWALVRDQFGDWYQNKVKEAANLSAAGKPALEVSVFLSKSLAELRRTNADKIMASSTATLRNLAATYQAIVAKLGADNPKNCVDYIVHGEAVPPVVEVTENPDKNGAMVAHLTGVFTAIAEGAKAPMAHQMPTPADDKLLAAELGKFKWDRTALNTFSDPMGYTKVPAERYCSMMQELVGAHLAVADAGAQERLLNRTLSLVFKGP